MSGANGLLCRDVALHMHAAGMFARLRDVICKLHAKQVVHVGAECFFNAQGHIGGERGLAMEQVGEGGAANFEDFGRLCYGQAQLLDDLGSDEVA